MFTLIPYIPIDNIQQHILMVLRDFLPLDVYHLLEATIEDIVIKKKGSLLSIGLFLAIMLLLPFIGTTLKDFNDELMNKIVNIS
jgi:membrane protein